MNNIPKSESYSLFKEDIKQILRLKENNSVIDEICLLSWKVSFMTKKQRIEEISTFMENNNSINTFKKLQQYNIFELILSLSHFRRAKYKNYLYPFV